MKFEKLNENKIRITLSMHDLEEKDIDFHDFMSNSIESQDLFLDMLEEAEEKIGFHARNCKVKIEALAMTENNFVLTITKIMPCVTPKKKPKVKRKVNDINISNLVYKFNSFDDYCNFIEFMLHNKLEDAIKVANKIIVYVYNDNSYLVLSDFYITYIKSYSFFTAITEFASYMPEPDLYVCRLSESGTIAIKNNAFKKGFNYFAKNRTN